RRGKPRRADFLFLATHMGSDLVLGCIDVVEVIVTMEVASGITQPPGLATTILPDAPSSAAVRCGRVRPL
ncbi:MAG: hypothetical protein VYD70_01585, partial [Planctomycetota bacterium]|nr:hypothetical protein [Planctomycetota bacterium]